MLERRNMPQPEPAERKGPKRIMSLLSYLELTAYTAAIVEGIIILSDFITAQNNDLQQTAVKGGILLSSYLGGRIINYNFSLMAPKSKMPWF